VEFCKEERINVIQKAFIEKACLYLEKGADLS
jgi:hypothetical protein